MTEKQAKNLIFIVVPKAKQVPKVQNTKTKTKTKKPKEMCKFSFDKISSKNTKTMLKI